MELGGGAALSLCAHGSDSSVLRPIYSEVSGAGKNVCGFKVLDFSLA